MKTFNKIQLLGHIGNEVKFQEKENTQFAQFPVAENYKPKNGEEITTWHNVVAFNGLAKLISEKCKKGQAILIEGRLQVNTYTDNEGTKRQGYSIVANEVTFL
jgi:single-strand DNA-binding protein